MEDESLMSVAGEHLPNTSLNLSTGLAETSNASIHLDEDTSFRARGQFDLTFSNLSTTDQTVLVRLKEAFQLYLRKEEVIKSNYLYVE